MTHTHVVVRHGANGATSIIFTGMHGDCVRYTTAYNASYQEPGYISIEERRP